jgi:hypothetical protein
MRKQAISDSNLTGASDDGQTAELAGSLGQTSQSRHHPGQPSGTEYRSIDGSGNNLSNSALNAAGTDFARIGPAHFADGVDSMRDGPNPRMISNVVVGQGDADVPNAEGLSGLMYAWGQFLDHDLDLSRSDGVTHIDIPIPDGDPNYPDGSSIPLTRAITDPATGHDGQPAAAVNSITGWLDASMVYGSDQATAHSLRTADGHMKTSAGNNLPINADGTFAAGDVRAQENPSLTALQTLFVREHNYQVDQLHREHPNWTGDHLYEQARAIVAGEIQNITYSEFLPHLLGPGVIPAYGGYDPHVDPRITEEFAGAAFRFGHSIVSDETERYRRPTSPRTAARMDSCDISVPIHRGQWMRASSTACAIFCSTRRPGKTLQPSTLNADVILGWARSTKRVTRSACRNTLRSSRSPMIKERCKP